MDENLQKNSFSEQAGQTKTKKVLLIVAVAGAFTLLLVLIALSFLSSKNPQPQPTAQAGITPPQSNSKESPASTNPSLTSQTYKLTETFNPTKAATALLNNYTVKYPKDWPPVMTYINKAGTDFLFSIFPGSISGDDGYFPRLDISYQVATQSGAVQKRADMVLTDTGNPKLQVVFHGYPAIKISGPLHMTLLDSNPPGVKVQVYKTYYVFQKGNLVYLVDYAYPGLKRDEQYETFFQGILNTFTFKQ